MDPTASTKRQRYLLGCAVLIPVAWSVLAAVRPAVPGPVSDGPGTDSLAFDQYLVNLRDVGLQPVLEGTYRFVNMGDEPLTITKLEPSCGCLSPKLAGDKKIYLPGEVGYFGIGVAAANEAPGPHTYTVKVHYTDPEPHESVVWFKLRLPERKVTIEPPELAFFQYSETPSEATVYITDYRGGEIGVTKATSTADFIEVEIQEAVTDEHGNTRVPVVLHVPGVVPPGRTISTLAVETTDPEFKSIRIPVLVDGPSRPNQIRQTGAEVPGPPLPQIP